MTTTFATEIGILPGQGLASANAAAYQQWAYDGAPYTHRGGALLFDRQGMYELPSEVLAVPLYRSLRGTGGAVIRAANQGKWLVRGVPSQPWALSDLTFDGAGLVDYTIEAGNADGTTGGSVTLDRVIARNGVFACVYGHGVLMTLRECTSSGGPVGFLFDGCSESLVVGLRGSHHVGAGSAFVRIVGSHANQSANGGRMSLFAVVFGSAGPPAEYGVDIDGVAQCDIHGMTVEGATAASLRVRRSSSNVRVFGFRANTQGACAVEFDDCNNAHVWGGCGASQFVRYGDGAQGCRAFLAAETYLGSTDIDQRWGSQGQWVGSVRPDGTVIGRTASPPTVGHWVVGDVVWSGAGGLDRPSGWRCKSSSPLTWSPIPDSHAPPLVVVYVPGIAQPNADQFDTLLTNASTYQIAGGFDGKRITIIATGQMRLSDTQAGNIWLDGVASPGRGFRTMKPGDTSTLMRIPLANAPGGYCWREVGRTQ